MDAPAPLTAIRGLTSWRLDVPVLVVVAVLALLYLAGVRRLSARGERWPVPRTVAFLALGLGSVVVVATSFLGVYDRTLFWPRAVQYIVLLSVTPLLLGTGAPLELARRCLTGASRYRLDAVLRSSVVRTLAFPLVGALLGVIVLMVVYLTPLYRASLDSEPIHNLVCLGLLVTGCVFFVPLLDQGEELLPDWCGYSLRVLFAFVDSLLDAVPGVIIMTMKGAIAGGYYSALHRSWGPSVHWDQTIGGGLMFTVSELVALPFLVMLITAWMRDDERRAAVTDAQLDRDAAASSDADGSVLSTRPWWETGPGPLTDPGARGPDSSQ